MEMKEIAPGVYVRTDGKVFREVSPSGRGPGGKYKCVSINGVRTDIHRLIAKAFIPNPQKHECVLHGDDNPSNNWVHNLRWGSHKDNMDDARKRHRNPIWEKANENFLDRIDFILTHIERDGGTMRSAAATLGVTESRVSQIVSKYEAIKKEAENLPADALNKPIRGLAGTYTADWDSLIMSVDKFADELDFEFVGNDA